MLTGIGIGIIGLLTVGFGLSINGAYASHLLPGFFLDGLGQGITWTLMWVAATSGIEPKDRGIASGMASTAQWVGSALGLALLVAVTTASRNKAGTSEEDILVGLRMAFVVAAGVASLAGLFVIGFVDRRTEHAYQPQPSGNGDLSAELLARDVNGARRNAAKFKDVMLDGDHHRR
jgi:sugar phosphate permease